MPTIDEGHLRFCFPDDWLVEKYDDTSFYRNQFIRCHDGIKAVDIVAFNPQDRKLFLIEIKDYRFGENTIIPSDLPNAVCCKITMTLAGIFAASLNANDSDERANAGEFLKCCTMQTVLHIEANDSPHQLGFKKSNLFQNIKDKLKQKIKSVDPHPKVANQNMMPFCWTVANI